MTWQGLSEQPFTWTPLSPWDRAWLTQPPSNLGRVCCPRDFLKNDISNARIFTLVYDSNVLKATKATSQVSIFSLAENLLNGIS